MILGVLIKALGASAVSRARVIGILIAGVVGVLLAWAISGSIDQTVGGSAVRLFNSYSVNLVIPIAALVVGTASLGDPIEDGTYVYLWLRPFGRWQISFAAFLVTVAATVPFAVLPALISVSVLDSSLTLILQTALVGMLAAVAYSAVFVLIGQLTSRGLVWGIGYLLIFEQFIARGGQALGFLSIHSHVVSVLSGLTDVDLTLDYYRVSTSVVALVVITVGLLGISSLRQSAMEVA